MTGETLKLAGLIAAGSNDTTLRRRQGVVTAVAGSRCSVSVGGAAAIDGLACLAPYVPSTGDTVWVDANGPDWLVIGPLAGSGAAAAVTCRVRNGGFINVSSTLTSFTTPTYDVVVHDPYDMAAANNQRLYVPSAGEYEATAIGVWDPNPTGVRGVQFTVNGNQAVLFGEDSRNAINSTTIGTRMCIRSEPVTLTVGDYIQARWQQNSGGTLALQAPRLALTRIGG